jgi:pseudouridine-5'-phosphate glycosidase
MSRPIAIATSVRAALARRRPVVALESTVLTHGLPRPHGLEAAHALEREVIAHGAIPATVGALDGVLHVGLDEAQLARLADAPETAKLNLSNLAAHLAAGTPGSTTVAATLFAAHATGIEVFATGGIGGVHREAAESFDVSADLTALARFPVAVVCAGAKAVLDLGKTIEVLETLGVPVFGFRTDAFPAFYRRDSGLPVDRRFDDFDALARAVRLHVSLGTGTGVVVANPIAAGHEMPEALYERALAQSLSDARAQGVRGRAVTPFLLDRMRDLTKDQSVFSNLALLQGNAAVAAGLAGALSRLEHD